jgi:hypothetical protein
MTKTPIAAAAVAAVALAGCGSSGTSGSQSTATAASQSRPPAASTRAATGDPYLTNFKHVKVVGSTVPANGDVNPYGLVVVPNSAGKLHAGELLISNFNAKSNSQGTGTTIVELTPSGHKTLFAQLSANALPAPCPGGVGLTTALDVLPDDYVVVGSLPTTNGQSATAQYGCLIVLDDAGKPVSTIAGANIQGPWDMTEVTHGSTTSLFVSQVLNGGPIKGRHTVDNSTVVRIDLNAAPGHAPKILSQTVVANGIPWRDDKAALVIGPTGVAVGSNGTLYVADTLKNRIIAVPNALTRTTALKDKGITLTSGGMLKQPLGLVLAPNGDILTTNAGDGNVVETSPAGKQLLARAADAKAGAGSLFGLAPAPNGRGLYFVDDANNDLRLLH